MATRLLRGAAMAEEEGARERRSTAPLDGTVNCRRGAGQMEGRKEWVLKIRIEVGEEYRWGVKRCRRCDKQQCVETQVEAGCAGDRFGPQKATEQRRSRVPNHRGMIGSRDLRGGRARHGSLCMGFTGGWGSSHGIRAGWGQGQDGNGESNARYHRRNLSSG